MFRTLFRPLARKAVQLPIETIVFFFVLSTLAYFHLLDAVKHSAFLSPSAATLRPAYVHVHNGQWKQAQEADWHDARKTKNADALELQQFVLSRPTALDNVTRYITRDLTLPSGKSYQALCHTDMNGQCFTATTMVSTRTPALSLAFEPKARDGFVDALHRKGRFAAAGVQLNTDRHESLAEMKNGMWTAYAARALVVRFWDLAKVNPF